MNPLFALPIIIATIIIAILVRKIFNRKIIQSAKILDTDPTNYTFLGHALVAGIYILGIGWALSLIPQFRQLSQSLLAGAGILAAVIGFASQSALSNIVGGIFIIIFKPFRINDRITLDASTTGIVEDINLRHTTIRNFENQRIVIPNSTMSSVTVMNADLVDPRVLKWLEFDISYDSNVELAKSIILKEILNHPDCIDGRTPEEIEAGVPQVVIRMIEWGSSYVRFRAWVWAPNSAAAFRIKCDTLESVKREFESNGIEIPFPHQTTIYKGYPKDNIDVSK